MKDSDWEEVQTIQQRRHDLFTAAALTGMLSIQEGSEADVDIVALAAIKCADAIIEHEKEKEQLKT